MPNPLIWNPKTLSMGMNMPCEIDETGELNVFSNYRKIDVYSRELATYSAMGVNKGITDHDFDKKIYSVYRYLFDSPELIQSQAKFDITCMSTNGLNGELPRTRGHFHIRDPRFRQPYFDIYQVQSGEVIVQVHPKPGSKMPVYLITATEGDVLCLPPDMCHVVYNCQIGYSAFTNWCTRLFHLDYESMASMNGPAFYLNKYERGVFTASINQNYAGLAPQIQVLKPQNTSICCEYFDADSPYIFDWRFSNKFLALLNKPDFDNDWIERFYVPNSEVKAEIAEI